MCVCICECELLTSTGWAESAIAIASRTNKARWAHALLARFELPSADGRGRRLSTLLSYVEIYSGSKTRHFHALREKSGIPFDEMIFFDDALGGKYGNWFAAPTPQILSRRRVRREEPSETTRWYQPCIVDSDMCAPCIHAKDLHESCKSFA